MPPNLRAVACAFLLSLPPLLGSQVAGASIAAGSAFAPGTIAYAGARYRYVPFPVPPAGVAFFEIRNKPVWATFNARTGVLEGIPGSADVGTSAPVEIACIGGGTRTVIAPAFRIDVQQLVLRSPARLQLASRSSADGALQIQGSVPFLGRVGVAYDASISAVVRGATPYFFTIRNKPGWATFDARSGKLHGTPKPADAGTYRDVRISLVGGGQIVELPSFAISILPASPLGNGAASATLRWSPPLRNVDGSELRNLAGYVIYWGLHPQALRPVTVVNDSTAVSQVFYGLPAGFNYFAVSAVNQNGVHSELGPVVSKHY